jgi:hypothetical protein
VVAKKFLFYVIALISTSAFGDIVVDTMDRPKHPTHLLFEKKLVDTIEFPDPVASQKFGFEWSLISIAPLLSSTKREYEYYLAGTIAVFDHATGFEYAMPFYYGYELVDGKHDFHVASVDLRFRKYLFSKLDGLYAGLFYRLSYLQGPIGPDAEYDHYPNYYQVTQFGREWKVGVGAEIGYRIFTDGGLYYGFSINFGGYAVGRHNIFRNDLGYAEVEELENGDSERFINAEFFKFGYAF